jgi:AraC-like DNA-binding protein
MAEIETAIRLVVIGQEFLIALLLLLGIGDRSIRIAAALLAVSVAGYLFNSDPVLRESVPALLPLVTLFSIAAPFCLWAFARAVFEAAWPRTWVIVLILTVATVSWFVFSGWDFVTDAWVQRMGVLWHIVALVVVIHTLWLAAAGRPDDLLETRRRFRTVFVVLISVQASAILVVEMAFGSLIPSGWLTLINVLFIGGLTIGFAIMLFRLSPVFFASPAATESGNQEHEEKGLSAADRVLHQKLLGSISDGGYRQSGLTIRTLAAELGFPEHQVRRLINRHLGFRNFSAFLNSYRIEEAKSQLGQEKYARTPVLTIALDLGYGSLGPFNRAFKTATGMTPTSYREREIPGVKADSEKT